MRLIDADALMEKANEHYRLALKRTEEAPFNDRYREQAIEREKFLGFIGNAPTVEPQKIVTIPPELIEKLASCVVNIVGNIDWEKAIEAYKERPQGEWLEVKEEVHFDYWTVCECSLCKHSWALGELSIEDVKDDYNFCPNCGADMRGGRQ